MRFHDGDMILYQGEGGRIEACYRDGALVRFESAVFVIAWEVLERHQVLWERAPDAGYWTPIEPDRLEIETSLEIGLSRLLIVRDKMSKPRLLQWLRMIEGLFIPPTIVSQARAVNSSGTVL